MKNIALHWKISIGLAAGFLWAWGSIMLGVSDFTQDWIRPFGTIFIRLLKMIAIPVVLFSIVSGVVSLGKPAQLGRLGLKTLSLYLGTTLVAISLGLALVNAFTPGQLDDQEAQLQNRAQYEQWAATKQFATRDGQQLTSRQSQLNQTPNSPTNKKLKKSLERAQETKQSPLQFLVNMVPDNIFGALGNNSRMLQIIFFAIFFGLCLAQVPDAAPVAKLIQSLDAVFILMVEKIMLLAPYFVFALVAGEFSKLATSSEAFVNSLVQLSSFAGTCFLGLLLMVVGVYPLLLSLFKKDFSYRKFFKAISPAQALAFSTSSSAATLPVTMECTEKQLGVRSQTTSFVLPIGATVNMDGSSLYIAVSVVFLAQFHAIDLSFQDQLIILFTSALASIGTAAVPSASLVMMMIVLQTIELNPAWIAIILPFDRILDMCRTVVNVTGDAAVCCIVDEKD